MSKINGSFGESMGAGPITSEGARQPAAAHEPGLVPEPSADGRAATQQDSELQRRTLPSVPAQDLSSSTNCAAVAAKAPSIRDFSHFRQIYEDLGLVVDHSPLPEVVREHHQDFPYRGPKNDKFSQVWLEGSFNPLTSVHFARACELFEMGYQSIVVGTLPYNPRKPREIYEELHHRVELWKKMARHYDIPIAKKPSDTGLWFTETPFRCHYERYKSWFHPERMILMGPDNFTHFRTTNQTWALFFEKNPVIAPLQRFNLLYNNVFKGRILVPDTQYVLHSTAIRSGEELSHPVIQEYIERHKLTRYGFKGNESSPDKKPE